ncbi:hypothetical protein GUI51_13395 [Enterococcus mundtii]|uniref:Gram-positive cocci surface proteins LPxTG domain-containing protein n=1 Tax=Enterococcus mundtii TaxID=53346 RepID=A0ABQ0VGX6_ENTMU|nr:hypothetical protein [Enterococcus mundtii]MZU11517.1 hypothetical protein [Bifidobacterium longum]GEN18602.1 hypothetical protein LAC02_18830 [Ligilactobacillus acidipiscis]AUB54433.1 hypothetical protein EM4838_15560 [Enterococcus mundtii]MZZ60080.1 hypothetical protein [Enterococcus mundtii]MZZ63084.1 hypothetical protein [Enterococcus mundtii]
MKIRKQVVFLFIGILMNLILFSTISVNSVFADANQTELTLIIEEDKASNPTEINNSGVLPKLSEKSSSIFLQIGMTLCLVTIIGYSFQKKNSRD